MAKIHMNLTNYPLKVLQGYEVSVNNFDSTIENICNLKMSRIYGRMSEIYLKNGIFSSSVVF